MRRFGFPERVYAPDDEQDVHDQFSRQCHPHYMTKVEKGRTMVCGVRVENVDDPLMQKIRYLDNLVDELPRGKSLDMILSS
jgi:hypothetical protein